MVRVSLAVITVVTVTNNNNIIIIIIIRGAWHTSSSAGILSKPREGTEAESLSATKIKGCSRRTLPQG